MTLPSKLRTTADTGCIGQCEKWCLKVLNCIVEISAPVSTIDLSSAVALSQLTDNSVNISGTWPLVRELTVPTCRR